MRLNLTILFLLVSIAIKSQQRDSMIMYLNLDTLNHIINGKQIIIIKNRSGEELKNLFLHAWTNGFKNNKTPLTKALLDDYRDDLYFSNIDDRGYIDCLNFSVNDNPVNAEVSMDIIKIPLSKPFKPNETIRIETDIQIKIQNSKFSHFGYEKNIYRLKDWHLTPAVYKDKKWQLMSNKNFDDLLSPPMDYVVNLTIPINWYLESDFDKKNISKSTKEKNLLLTKKNATRFNPIIKKERFIKLKIKKERKQYLDFYIDFEGIPYKVVEDKKLIQSICKESIDFIEKTLGEYPYNKILISKAWLNKNPIPELYINELTSINVIPKKQMWQLSLFKLILNKFIENTIFNNSRQNRWLKEGLKSFIMHEYISKYLKNPKLLKELSDLPIINYYNFSKLRMNDKHALINLYISNKKFSQKLSLQTDSLYKFNRLYGNNSKVVLILSYIKDRIGKDKFNKIMQNYYENNKLKISSIKDFLNLFEKNDKRLISAFVYDSKDIKFKEGENMFNLDFSNNESSTYNFSNVFKDLNVKLIGDIEQPYGFNIFISPLINWDDYNKFSFGLNLYNHLFLDNLLNFNISPTYSSEINKIIGSYSFYFLIKNRGKRGLFENIKIGSSYNKSLWAYNKFFYKFYPYINLELKSNSIRKKVKQQINIRLINIEKQINKYENNEYEQNNYSILNINYNLNENHTINNFTLKLNFEFSKKFQKLYLELIYIEKLTNYFKIKNRNFLGTFLYNNATSDYYDFNLNDPNDYLFDKSYLGRSNKSGILSQQTFISEGGFKSKLNFKSKDWLISNNLKLVFFNTISLYIDLAASNNLDNTKLFFDSGMSIDILTDIFELYFPFYSSNGIAFGDDYFNKIRFLLNTDLITLIQKSISKFFY